MNKEQCQDRKDSAVKQNQPKETVSKKDLKWEKPVLEDVSGRVMAQPYIRFT